MGSSVGTPRQAIAYIRVSTDAQELGEQAQRAQITSWAQRGAVEVVSWHVERISGGADLEERAELLYALDVVRAYKGSLLVVARRDRLARDVVVAALVERLTERAGGRVVSCAGEGTDQDDPASRLLRQIVDSFSQYERELIRQRTKAALERKKAAGERLGKLPFGSKADGTKMSPDEYEAQMIARVLQLRREGRSVRVVVHILGNEGWKNRSGKPPTKSLVQRILERVSNSTHETL